MALINDESAVVRKARVPYDWRLVKVDEKSMICDGTWLQGKHVTACGVFYLIDANTHIHICSITPNLEAWPMQGFADFETDEDAEKDEGEVEMEMLNSADACSYFGTNILDKCPHKPAIDYVDFPEPEEGESDDNYRMRCADELREVLCGNPVWF
jgi:hypothetical protein